MTDFCAVVVTVRGAKTPAIEPGELSGIGRGFNRSPQGHQPRAKAVGISISGALHPPNRAFTTQFLRNFPPSLFLSLEALGNSVLINLNFIFALLKWLISCSPLDTRNSCRPGHLGGGWVCRIGYGAGGEK